MASGKNGHSHRPSGMHQSNKPFKSKHSSKSKIKRDAKGKITNSLDAAISASGKKKMMTKNDRKNAAKMEQKKKRDALKNQARLYSGKKGLEKVIAYVPLCPDLSADDFKCFGISSACSSKFIILSPEKNEKSMTEYLFATLDMCQVADIVLFGLSGEQEVDKHGMMLLSSLRAQSLPSSLCAWIPNYENIEPKSRNDVKRSLVAFMKQELGEKFSKLFVDHAVLGEETNETMMERYLSNLIPTTVKWRENRPYIVAEFFDYDHDNGVLCVQGRCRGGKGFSPNHLVHLKNFGDFQLKNIEILDSDGDSVIQNLFPNENQQSLEHSKPPNPEINDDNNATNIEFEEFVEQEKKIKQNMEEKLKKLPKGTSSYQAEWITTEDWETNSTNLDGESEILINDSKMEVEDEDFGVRSKYDLSPEEEESKRSDWLKRRQDELEEMEFPDEMQTPMDIPARVRFRKYRGLSSFRTSYWDPNEGLPADYSRIFDEESLNLNACIDETRCNIGDRIRLYISNVPDQIIKYSVKNNLLSVFGLIPGEQKMSVVNMTCHRPSSPRVTNDDDLEDEQPVIKSKDLMLIQCGFRRYYNRPIFSQMSSNGLSAASKLNKMEKFLFPGSNCIATVFAPIQALPASVLYFLPPRQDNSGLRLIASGVVDSIDPSRMIIKRKILTGHPSQIHKSSHNHAAVVRFMFFNELDVQYFKPIELYTKYGRRGHIVASIGTHGSMKCRFDKPLKSMDTVCLNLYKRVFPKWPASPYSEIFRIVQ